ncbi:hypothetical protein [Ruminococcus sp.]|uniref:hypothetical protein n=1 Tax=Ruminococcus sp. TaxID=41978 RepID=UPI0025FA381F|nr:hypothetical protein [Ruminococcus sp.]
MSKIREKYKKSPFLRRVLAVIDEINIKVGLLYWISAATFIIIIAFALYFQLPDKYRTAVTAIVGSVLTTIIVPIIINKIKMDNERKYKQYERNLPFYTELLSMTMKIMQTQEQTEQRQKIAILSNFIAEKYLYCCINLSMRQIDLLFNLQYECKMFFDDEKKARASIENFEKCVFKLLSELRKQGNVTGKFYYWERMIEEVEVPEIGING